MQAEQPRLLKIIHEEDGVTITWLAKPGHTYLIQSNSDLVGPWHDRLSHHAHGKEAEVKIPLDPDKKAPFEFFRIAQLTYSISSHPDRDARPSAKATATTTAGTRAATASRKHPGDPKSYSLQTDGQLTTTTTSTEEKPLRIDPNFAIF